jgi:hypothetical protein
LDLPNINYGDARAVRDAYRQTACLQFRAWMDWCNRQEASLFAEQEVQKLMAGSESVVSDARPIKVAGPEQARVILQALRIVWTEDARGPNQDLWRLDLL